MEFNDDMSTASFEYGYKCGACAHKFAAGMTLSIDGTPCCPRCRAEIVSFPTADDIRRNDYIAHTRHDRFHSYVVQPEDEP